MKIAIFFSNASRSSLKVKLKQIFRSSLRWIPGAEGTKILSKIFLFIERISRKSQATKKMPHHHLYLMIDDS